jgi:hypothetical protein
MAGPDRVLRPEDQISSLSFISEDGRVVGTWIMGNDYRVKSGYYGGYPAGYLKRIWSLFPDKRTLHIFRAGWTWRRAR